MIIVMRQGAPKKELNEVLKRIRDLGYKTHIIHGFERDVIGAIGDERGKARLQSLESLAGVEKVVPILKPYKLASREIKAEPTVIEVGGVKIGGDNFTVIAGPCSVEGREQIFETARAVKKSGAYILRGGAYKPRTSPYSFQGMEEEGLKLLAEAREATGLPVVTEIVNPADAEVIARYANMFQVGARNVQNFALLKVLGQVASGEIVFSGDQNEVGEINQKIYFHDIVAKGKVYAKVVPKDEESLEGQKVTRDVLETYVPLMNNGKFLGAFEIYYDITNRKKQLDKLLWRSSTIVIIFALGFLIGMIFMLYRENLAMKKRRQLEEERLQSERLKGVIEMAGAACHELNQPLQVLSGYSHLLLSDLSEDSPLFGEIKKIKEMVK